MAKITVEVEEGFIEELKKIAQQENYSHDPDWYVDDSAAGNIDDAYNIGRECAENDMAQWVLDQFGVTY